MRRSLAFVFVLQLRRHQNGGDAFAFLAEGLHFLLFHQVGDFVAGILAVDALNLMQSRHITSVLVADGDQLLGVLHMHDLLRAGVV